MQAATDDQTTLAWELEEMEDAWLGFKVHIAFYMIFNAALAFFDIYVEGGDLWFFWPLAGWGIGVVSHYLGLRQHERTLERRARQAGISLAELG